MDIARLNELKEETYQNKMVMSDHCMSTTYEDDILALIDAEIARQTPDAEIDRAIEHMEELKASYLHYCLEETTYPEIDLAITALQKMKGVAK